MASFETLYQERKEKLKKLRERGYEAYAIAANSSANLKQIKNDFDSLVEKEEKVWVAGRVMARRGHGALMFTDLDDGTDTLQAYFREDILSDDKFADFSNLTDLGDIVEVYGILTRTKRGEPSVLVEDWRMLTKSLRPLPEKWQGLKDDELRYRQRYLDLLLDSELREVFYKKAQFWQVARDFLRARNFIEFETPTLEITTGGAEARPFVTYHNDYDMDVYLRISVGELWQKRLMASGFQRTFEIGRVYRNEGSSPEHLQEFTNCEFYASFMSFEEGKELVRELYLTLAQEVFGTTKFETRGHSFDLANSWEDLDYVDTVERMTGINVLEASMEEMEAKLKELGVKFEGNNRERLTDTLWKYCRKQISGPAFLINHPKLVAPLSNEHPDDPRKTLTFQPILAGSELGRAHSELNDPQDQRERFLKQQSLLESGDDEAMMPDWEYVEMLEQGMPPVFGFGFGERLFSFLINRTIRETQAFPLIKPKKT